MKKIQSMLVVFIFILGALLVSGCELEEMDNGALASPVVQE